MAASNRKITRCGMCRFYDHEGRRGGHCSQLSVPVSSSWTACCLSDTPFASSPQPELGIDKRVAAPKRISPPRVLVSSDKKAAYSASAN